MHVPGKDGSPEMRFTLVDGKDFSASQPHTRFVEVTLEVGPATAPYWRGVVAYGHHAKT
ncbi:MAG: hypothetical protein ACREMP_03430 [Candidatus Tyrphobacter sp.]